MPIQKHIIRGWTEKPVEASSSKSLYCFTKSHLGEKGEEFTAAKKKPDAKTKHCEHLTPPTQKFKVHWKVLPHE